MTQQKNYEDEDEEQLHFTYSTIADPLSLRRPSPKGQLGTAMEPPREDSDMHMGSVPPSDATIESSPGPISDFSMAKAHSQLPEPKSPYGMDRVRLPKPPEPKLRYGMDRVRLPKPPEPKSPYGMDRVRPPKPPEPKSPYGMDRRQPPKPLEPKLRFGMDRARPKSPEPESGMQRTRSPLSEPQGSSSLSKSPRESHIASSEIPDVLLTLVHAGWVWGQRAPSPTEIEKEGHPSTGEEGERAHELVCPAVSHIGMAAD
jgi:hypothetical protein